MTVFARGARDYEALRRRAVWNGIVPNRFPAAIARPAGRREVAGLVRRARDDGLRVTVRSGGHNWRGACLRDGGLLIDLGGLQEVEVDAERRLARAEPGATHKVRADAIVPHSLGSYPPQTWQRLQAIRGRYDPDRIKLGYLTES